jgi:hypothetical protein
MGKRRIIFFRLLVSVLFVFACDYSLFDTVREADFFFATKYEARDSEGLYAEKGSNLDGVLVSPTLFSPLPDTFFEFLPRFFSPNNILAATLSVLRC